ncbi:MAG: GNAT family N-acetyltransferase [Bdellovibrionota bacterium]
MSSTTRGIYSVRRAELNDIPAIIEICKAVYPQSPTWSMGQLTSHQRVFPEGQLVAISNQTRKIVGAALSLIVFWDDYDWETPWRDFTDHGMFTNHDPAKGRTLYGAEIMVHPDCQRTGVGRQIYQAREDLARRLGLLRIRAGARLRGYHQHASKMTADEYVLAVIDGKLSDPTLSFQLKRGFHVLRVVPGYLRHDPESLGFAAVIEWINPEVATEDDYKHLKESKFYKQTD